MITVIGMGRKVGDLTVDGKNALEKATKVVVKSEKTHMAKALEQLGVKYVSCDDLYVSAENFDELNGAIIERLGDDAVLCVYGNGTDDSTVCQMAKDGKKFELICGVSVGESVLDGRQDGYAVFNAFDFIESCDGDWDSLLIKSIDDGFVASEVKLKLLENFDYDTEIVFGNSDGCKKIPLEDLDKQSYDYQTCVFIEKRPIAERKVYGYKDVLSLMRILRGKNGCPWDRAQTHASIEGNLLEEAYELASAIRNQDVDNMIEELGDLLMQFVFHVRIADEEGEFVPSDVYSALCNKLVSRHTHIFGQEKANDESQALANWEKAKQKEHKVEDLCDYLDDIPVALPSLLRAEKAQSRSSKYGYDFGCDEQIKQKIAEEIAEFEKADEDSKAEEGGDLLFAVINLLRFNHVDCEVALNKSIDKYLARVKACEKILAERGEKLKDLSARQFDELWNRVKNENR